MHNHTFIKRSLAAVLMTAAAAFPASAQAFHPEDASSAAQVPVMGPPPASLQGATASLQSADSSFAWGDAGIGAAGMLTLLGVGAGVVTRNRQRQDLVGG